MRLDLVGDVSLPENPGLALTIVGVVLLLLALAGPVILSKIQFKLGKAARFVVGGLGIVLLVFGLSDLYGSRDTPCPTVAIDSPAANDRTPKTVPVSGTASGSPGQWTLWLVVNPAGEAGWWPQGSRLAPAPPGGRWEQKVFLGGAQGQRFKIAVVCASLEAHQEFIAYLKHGAETGDFPGRPLPVGASVVAVVDVILDE
jgi:hypothetical protein